MRHPARADARDGTHHINDARAKASRISWLDGLRAYAIAGVVLVHSTRIGGVDPASAAVAEIGQYGVQLFFVISAATVFLTIRDPQAKGMPIGSWYLRRFLRIAPLYYAAIVGYLALNLAKARLGAATDPNSFEPLHMLANVLFIHAWTPGADNEIVPGGWSIGVEMTFYLIAPALLWLLQQRRGLTVLLAIVATFVAGIALLEQDVRSNSFLYFWPPTQLPVLLLLGLAFVHTTRAWLLTDQRTPKPWTLAGWIALPSFVAIGGLLGVWGELAPALAPTAFGAAGCALVLLARDPLRRAFDNRLAVWLGSISYSVYVCHFAVVEVLAFVTHKLVTIPTGPVVLPIVFVVILAAASGMAILTKRYIEDPGNRLRPFAEPSRTPSPAAST